MLAWGHTQGLSNQHLCDLKHLAHLLRRLIKMLGPSAVGGSSGSGASIFPLGFLSCCLTKASRFSSTQQWCLCHKAQLLLACALWTSLKGCQLSLLLLEKAQCWHLPFRVLNARGITRVQHGGFRTVSAFQSVSFTFWCLGGGIYDSRFPKSWLKGWGQPGGGPAKETCNLSGKLGSPFLIFYRLILWRAVQLALVAPKGNITISFYSLSIIWYCSICPQVTCVVFLNLHLSRGSWRHFLRCIAVIIWPAIAICVSIMV